MKGRGNAGEMITVILVLTVLWTVTATQREITHTSSFGTLIGIVNDAITIGSARNEGIRFQGIPYAKPPTGARRFQKPEPAVNLPETYNATYFRPVCPQSRIYNQLIDSFTTDEDCLHLNLFLPGSTVTSNNSYPVMVWIYGGGFMTGLADIYFSDILSSVNNVIVVTFNYRVNALGFLDDGTGAFANNGLHDQKLAIDWVNKHIQSFGGDPSRVTLFGESAGAASVIYQALNPNNTGKIHRVIAESGSVLASWAFQPNPRESYQKFAAKLNCTLQIDALACIKATPIATLINTLDENDSFYPTEDGDFLTTDPDSLLANHSQTSSESLRAFSSVDFLSGFNSKDGGNFVIAAWTAPLNMTGINIADGVPRQVFESLYVPAILNNVHGNKSSNALIAATVHEYVDWQDPGNDVKIRDAMIDLSTDLNFLVPAVRTANKHVAMVSGRKTYLYQFSHRPVLLEPAWLQDGALHTWELAFVFGLTPYILIGAGIQPGMTANFPAVTMKVASDIMTYWTNFAKTGNPNSDGLLPQWPVYDLDTQEYIDLTSNLTSASIQSRPAASRVNFWTSVAPLLYNTSMTTDKICDMCNTNSAKSEYANHHAVALLVTLVLSCRALHII